MASAAFESVKMVRAAIRAEQRRLAPEPVLAGGEPHFAAGPAASSRLRRVLRGVGASVVIAFGYAAFVTGLRWLLTLA